MIQHALHEEQYLNAHKFYKQIYDSESIKQDDSKWKDVGFFCVCVCVCQLINIAYRFLRRQFFSSSCHPMITSNPISCTVLMKIPTFPRFPCISKYRTPLRENKIEFNTQIYRELAKCFVTSELMRWPKIEELYGEALGQTTVFSKTSDDGIKRWKELHHRVIEHNIRVIAKYYTRVTTKRLMQLLDLSEADTEEFLSKLVVSKTIYARVDRPAGVISFQVKKDANQVLNDWSSDINSLLNLVEKTCHLISKEVSRFCLMLRCMRADWVYLFLFRKWSIA